MNPKRHTNNESETIRMALRRGAQYPPILEALGLSFRDGGLEKHNHGYGHGDHQDSLPKEGEGEGFGSFGTPEGDGGPYFIGYNGGGRGWGY